MKRNGSGNGRLRTLAAEMDAKFERMGHRFQQEVNGLRRDMDSRFSRLQKQFQKDVRGLQKTARGVLKYVIHLDEEFQHHRHDKVAHFHPQK